MLTITPAPAMSKLVRILIGMIAGYVIGAALGLALVTLFSTNAHDKNVEMVMTAAFVTGPVGAVIGVITGMLKRRG